MDEQQERDVKGGRLRNTNTIFIIEDDPTTGSMLSEIILQETSYLPVLLADGLQVLKITQHIKPSLFLIDYYLPKMNGLELYDQIHAKEELQDVPVIIIGASLEGHQHAIEGRGLVAINKPFELDELLATIQGILVQVPD